jgi:hypothetical protein
MKIKSLMLLLACTVTLSIQADPVSLKEAQQKALAFMRTGSQPKAIRNARCVKCRISSATTTDQPVYIFNRGENQGFVIVSGNNSLPDIIGYTDSGDYDESKLPPALLDMIEGYAELAEKATAANLPPRKVSAAHASWQDVDPLVPTHWNQGWPYNNRCPYLTGTTNRSITGCVATAACQVLYYYHKDLPDTLLKATPTYTYGAAPVTYSFPKGTPIKWDLMQMSYSGGCPYEMTNAVAVLMAATGAATWLTYGSSTSGQISNCVGTFANYFRLNSSCTYKGGSQESWEQMIYNDLKARRPMLYTGVVPAQSSGHAFVLDGYSRSADKFHFNFGWGGQGDGYYTVDDNSGCNGFSSSQGMVHGIVPAQPKLSASLVMPARLFYRQYNEFQVTVTNNGTLPCQGIYLYASRIPMTRFQPNSSIAYETTTVIQSGESRTLTLRHKPMLIGPYHYYVSDTNGNLLASDTAVSIIAHPQLSYDSLNVSASADHETIGDNVYHKIYSSKAAVSICLKNGGSDPFEGLPLCDLYESNDNGVSFHPVAHTTVSATVEIGKSVPLTFNFANLKTDSLYCARLAHTVSTFKSTDTITAASSTDTVTYFKVMAPTLCLDTIINGCAHLSGSWDAGEFSKIAKANAAVTSYDLTNVKYIADIPQIANPNTLFYVSDDAQPTGHNVIRGGVCDDLQLTYGYDFCPKADFTAKRASMLHGQSADEWNGIILPFSASVPAGIFARRIDQLKVTYIYRCQNVTRMEAGTPYLFIPSQDTDDRFTAQNVQVLSHVSFNATDSVCGTFTSLPASASDRVIDHVNNYFDTVAEGTLLPAFSLYLNYPSRVRLISYPYLSTDAAYLRFASSIHDAAAVYEQYLPYTEPAAQTKLQQVIADARQGFTNHAYETPTDITSATALLDSIVNVYLTSALVPVKAGDDFTSRIVNPSFEDGKTGWTVDANASIHHSTELAYTTVGIDGNNILYNCLKADSTSTGVSQTVSGLPNGYYRLTALIATDSGAEISLFAGDKSVTVSAHPFGVYYFNQGTVDSLLVTDGTLQIGTRAARRPYKLDHFTLTYLGAKPDPDRIDNTSVTDADFHVIGAASSIRIETSRAVDVHIYDLSGRLMKQVKVPQGNTVITSIPRGLYIVNGQKVVVR